MADRPPIHYVIVNAEPGSIFNYKCAIGYSPDEVDAALAGRGKLFLDYVRTSTKIGAMLAVRNMARKKRKRKVVKPYRKVGIIK